MHMPECTIRRASAEPRDLRAARYHNPESYGGLPSDPHVPRTVRLWKYPLKWLGNLAVIGGLVGVTLHYLRFGPKQVSDDKPEGGAK